VIQSHEKMLEQLQDAVKDNECINYKKVISSFLKLHTVERGLLGFTLQINLLNIYKGVGLSTSLDLRVSHTFISLFIT
jgi:hypothetical protein